MQSNNLEITITLPQYYSLHISVSVFVIKKQQKTLYLSLSCKPRLYTPLVLQEWQQINFIVFGLQIL